MTKIISYRPYFIESNKHKFNNAKSDEYDKYLINHKSFLLHESLRYLNYLNFNIVYMTNKSSHANL
jgi:hypothetical protein